MRSVTIPSGPLRATALGRGASLGVFTGLEIRRRDSVATLGIMTSCRLLRRERKEEGISNSEYRREDLREDRSSSSFSSWPLLFPESPLSVSLILWGIAFSFPDSALGIVILVCGLWRRKIELMAVGDLLCITAVLLVLSPKR
jgi:hypothetical protein